MKTIPRNPEDLRPDETDIAYGPHERNVFDLYAAPGDGPHPLLIHIHGGGFRKDMADPENPDPVLRQSTRPRCVLTYEGQTSYDPRFVERVVGGGQLHPALPQLFGVPETTWPGARHASPANRSESCGLCGHGGSE